MSTNRHRRSKGRYAKQTHKLRNVGVGVIATFVGLLTIGACTAPTCYGLDGMPAECTGVSESHPPIDARVRDDGSWVLRAGGVSSCPTTPVASTARKLPAAP